jgi:tetratricopeptide (TPR) repeat protein
MEPVSQEIEAGQASGPEVDSVPPLPGAKPATEELRASLAAVRAARDAAQFRLRRDTRQIRVVSLMFVAAFAAGALAVVGHFRGARRGAGRPVAAAPAARPPGIEGAGSTAAPLGGATVADPPPSPGALVPAPAASAEPAPPPSSSAGAEAAPAPDLAETLAACNQAYEAHRWPAATETCARCADLRPRDAALAMKVAQAFHARGRYADAGVWARRALELNDVDPEALVIVAHAERRAGHPAAAKSAYRRYLVLAPRGWHAAEARAAVRPNDRPRPRARSGSASARLPAAPFASSADSNADQR